MNIDRLPPEMLAIILKDKRISLSKRIALRAVSSHWQETIEQHVLKFTTKLALSHNDIDDVPRLPFKAELIPLLGRLFPALADLIVRVNVHQAVPRLLTAFSTTLTTLKLCLSESSMPRLDDVGHHVQWINLASAINSLTILTSLDLDLRHVLPPNTLLFRLVPTLPRLQKFHYSVYRLFVPAEHWQNITLGPLMRMTDLKVQHATTLDYATTVADTAATFPSLQSLILNLNSQEENNLTRFTDMLRSLSALEHLSELSLSTLYYSSDQLALPTDRPLFRVTKLTLGFGNRIDDNELFTSVLVEWFPSLEEFNISCHGYILLTSTTLRNFARLKHLSELNSDIRCALEVPLDHPTDQRLASLKTLQLTIGVDDTEAQLFSSALIAWFPRLEHLTLVLDKSYGITAMLRDLAHLEHLSEIHLYGLQFEKDGLCLPSSSDGRLLSVKKLFLAFNIFSADSPNVKYLTFTALAAWFPDLEKLSIGSYGDNDDDAFNLSIDMLSGLATLKHLTELRISNLEYAKKRFPMPTSTDQVLSRVKSLKIEFNPWLDSIFSVKRHICSVLAAWFPCLEKLEIDLYHDDDVPYTFYLASSMLADLSRLEHLRELNLPIMLYSKGYMEAPSPTDRPLTCLRKLTLVIVDPPEVFDGQHFCSTVAAWFSHLEEVAISPPQGGSHNDDSVEYYHAAIWANRHYFADSIIISTSLGEV